MLIPNIPEEPDLVLRYEHRHAECMYRRISKSLVVEAPTSVQPLEIHIVCLSTKEIEVSNFKIGEELAIVIVATVVSIEKPVEICFWMD